MLNNNRISLVIPVLNEENNIGLLLSCVPKSIDDIIIVDNGSVDGTVGECRRLGAQVIYEKKKGYGSALRTGILSADGDIIVCMDGDATYPLIEAQGLLNDVVNNDYDFVSAERILIRDAKGMQILNKMGNKLISWCIRKYFGVRINDSQSGMWVFKRKITSKILPISPGMDFSQEIKLRAWLKPDIRCNEIKVKYCLRSSGKSKFRRIRDSFLVLNSFLKLAKEFRDFI